MPTLTSVRPCHHSTIRLTTRHETEFVDLTEHLADFVAERGVRIGLVNVQTRHTTTAIVVNEHEPLLLDDFRACLERIAPRGVDYRHDDMQRRTNIPPGEPRNGHAHCRALFLPSSACLNVMDGRLDLGRWQRVLLLELDGPRERQISVVVQGDER
jgi:secondary thiamine-phosphate synthase enzyme